MKSPGFSICLNVIVVIVSVLVSGCENPGTQPPFGQSIKGDFVEGGIPARLKKTDHVTEKAREFFVEWLKGHGETEIVNNETGVGVSSNKARLFAFHYDTKKSEDNCSVEVEFRIVLPDGREIQEFLAGLGKTEDEAINQCFLNFTLSSFHCIYSCFMNTDDEHVVHEKVEIDDVTFTYTTDGVFALGGDDLPDFSSVKDQIKSVVVNSSFANKVHWLKFVYGEHAGKKVVLSVTQDNHSNDKLLVGAKTIRWPRTDSFYMAKQFIVLRPE